MKRAPAMKHREVKRQDLARTLAQRSPLSESQAQDELDRVVHDVVTSLRQGLPAEMPGVGQMTAKPSTKKSSTRTFRKSAARQP